LCTIMFAHRVDIQIVPKNRLERGEKPQTFFTALTKEKDPPSVVSSEHFARR